MRSDIRVICPYLQQTLCDRIICEGYTDGSCNHMTFSEQGRLQRWQHVYCQNRFELCPVGYLLGKKYE